MGLVICTLIIARMIDVIIIIANENENNGAMKILTMYQPTNSKILSTYL